MPRPANAATEPDDRDRRRPEFQQLRADGRRMLTPDEAAGFLNTTVDIVRKLIASGELRAVKLSERNTRIPERHLVAFIDRC